MAIARSEIVVREESGLYHCISRCVRRGRRWIRQRLRELSEIYAIDIVAFVVMSNHMHVLLWTDPDRVRSWSDREVAARWLRLFPTSAAAGAKDLETAIQWLAMDGARIKLLRGRLADLSWFMKCLKEPIARRANREDDCTGAFWEGRFKCFRVVDEGGALSCSVYIDLNVIFAGLAETPEGSHFTSVQERIRQLQAFARQQDRGGDPPDEQPRPSGRRKQRSRPATAPLQHPEDGLWLVPFDERLARDDRRVLFGFGAEGYLELVDTLGRIARGDKRGAIPAHLRPILERLQLDVGNWVSAMTSGVRRMWGTTVGVVSALTAEARGEPARGGGIGRAATGNA
jgi:hypothetical protein